MKLLYVVTEDWAFLSHRLPMARAAREAGWDVHVTCRVNRDGPKIRAEGFTLHPLRLNRRSRNPFRELVTVGHLTALYRREKPDLVHHVALKPVLYGALAARLTRLPCAIHALIGLGAVFTGERDSLLRRGITLAFRFLLNRRGDRILVQNRDDSAFFAEKIGLPAARIHLIRGSGVDTRHFAPEPEPPAGPIVAGFAGRLLSDKGVFELLDAARILKDKGVDMSFRLAGTPDPDNPRSLHETDLETAPENVSFCGRLEDMAAFWQGVHIGVLPSYREGLPKALLEAAACGRPLVTTDVPGCRELVKDGENGLLIPAGNGPQLAEALEKLAKAPDLRQRLGHTARTSVERHFSQSIVAQEIVALYTECAGRKGEATS